MEEIQNNILTYIENDNDEDDEYFSNLINDQKYQRFISKHKYFLFLLSKIINNHHRTENFFKKIQKIFFCLKGNIKQTFSNYEIFQIFKNNKLILLYLIQNKIIEIDQSIFNEMIDQNDTFQYLEYFLPEVKSFLLSKKYTEIKDYIFINENILISDDQTNPIYDEKRERGENGHYICHIIQNDFIDEFVSYVNQQCVPLSSTIKPSIFETNLFLLKQTNTTLIEYATFYGSIQIFNFLRINGVEINRSLWSYAIHGRNPEIIHYLEKVTYLKTMKKEVLHESMKCYHHELTEYIINNYYNENEEINKDVKFLNFSYFPNDLFDENSLYYLCKYDCYDYIKTNIQSFLSKVQIKDKNPINVITKLNNSVMEIFLENLNICKNSSGMSLFHNCQSITQIIFPSSLTEIGNWTFSRCSSLKKVHFSSSIVKIGDYSFYGCSSLSQVTFESESSLKSIGEYSFYGCSSLMQIEIPSTVNSIGDYSFGCCSSLRQFEVPSSLTSINDYLFYSCTGLSQVLFDSHSFLISIGSNSFAKCFSLKEIKIPQSVKSIGEKAFEYCKIIRL